jgi:hypothetical protein
MSVAGCVEQALEGLRAAEIEGGHVADNGSRMARASRH